MKFHLQLELYEGIIHSYKPYYQCKLAQTQDEWELTSHINYLSTLLTHPDPISERFPHPDWIRNAFEDQEEDDYSLCGILNHHWKCITDPTHMGNILGFRKTILKQVALRYSNHFYKSVFDVDDPDSIRSAKYFEDEDDEKIIFESISFVPAYVPIENEFRVERSPIFLKLIVIIDEISKNIYNHLIKSETKIRIKVPDTHNHITYRELYQYEHGRNRSVEYLKKIELQTHECEGCNEMWNTLLELLKK